MRKKIYPYNHKEIKKNQSRNHRRNLTKAICAVTLSATVLTSIPCTGSLTAYADNTQITAEALGASVTIPTENVITYDLFDPSLISHKKGEDYHGNAYDFHIIDINITQDGTYVIKGSNEINGAYVDTHISVAEGVTADIIFDGATIKNDDKYCPYVRGCGSYTWDRVETLFPVLDIAGTANIYVKSDSSLEAEVEDVQDNVLAEVTGTMVMKGSEDDAVLKLSAGERGAAVSTGRACKRRGTFIMEGGNLDAVGMVGGVDYYTCLSEVRVTGGNLTCSSGNTSNLYADNINISGGSINGSISRENGNESGMYAVHSMYITGGKMSFVRTGEVGGVVLNGGRDIYLAGGTYEIQGLYPSNSRCRDFAGRMAGLYTLEGLPENAVVTAINGQEVKDVVTTAEGTLCTYLAAMQNALIEIGDETYCYQYDSSNNTLTKSTDLAVHQVKVLSDGENGEVLRTMRVADGTTVGGMISDAQYIYSYETEDGTEVSSTTSVTEDMTLVLKKIERIYEVKITEGNDQSILPMKHTDRLPEGYLYADISNYKIYSAEDPINSDLSLKRLPVKEIEGKKWISIQSKENLDTFSTFLTIDPYLNVRLDADLDYTGDTSFAQYSKKMLPYDFYGIFDGNGHSILNLQYGAEAFTDHLYGTVRNLQFKNMTSGYKNNTPYGSGLICAMNYGTIENCLIEDATIKTTALNEGEKAAGKGIIAGNNFGTIRNCLTVDAVFEGDGEQNPIAKNKGGTIENTYYTSAEATEDGGRTAEQFASGEICYLLNEGRSDEMLNWYQNIGTAEDENADAVPVFDQTHKTVYSGYAGCKMSYTNDKDAVTAEPVHDVTYQAKDDQITAVCVQDATHTAGVSVTAENADYDGKAHEAEILYSEDWESLGLKKDLTLTYERNGQETEDLTTEGEITALLTVGDATAKTTYTITKKPEPSPGDDKDDNKDPDSKDDNKDQQGSESGNGGQSGSDSSNGGQNSGNNGQNSQDGQNSGNNGQSSQNGQTSGNNGQSSQDGQNNNNNAQTDQNTEKIKKGTKFTDKKGNLYAVTSVKKKELTFVKPKKGTKGSLTIPASISVKGVKYKVTSISANACKGNKKLTKVIIGVNIKKIGKRAFYGCTKLKNVTIKTTKLTKKSIGKDAFAKIGKSAKIKASKKISRLFK